MSRCEKVFKKELSLVKNSEIRDWTINVFNELAPDYFWTCPASSSGKYHPKVSLGDGGLVRHTKLAVWWGVELYKALPEEVAFTTDEVVAALLLHDLLKYGEDYEKKMKDCVSVHGGYLVDKINGLELNDKKYWTILDGVAAHMGKWTKEESDRPAAYRRGSTSRIFCELVHLADYCSSRKVDDKVDELMKGK